MNKVLPKNYFLVVVDVQNDFFDLENSSLPIPDSKQIIDPLNDFIKHQSANQCTGILFTQDWHDEDHVEFMPDGQPFPKHCVNNTFGADLVTSAVPTDIPQYNIRKNVFDMWQEPDLYVSSANSDHIGRDEFFKNIHSDGINDVVVIGVASDICVNFAIKGLVERGFNVTVVRSLCKGLYREIDQVVQEDYNNTITVI